MQGYFTRRITKQGYYYTQRNVLLSEATVADIRYLMVSAEKQKKNGLGHFWGTFEPFKLFLVQKSLYPLMLQ